MKHFGYELLQLFGYVALTAGIMLGAFMVYGIGNAFLHPAVGPDSSMPVVLAFFVLILIAAPISIFGLVVANYCGRAMKQLNQSATGK